MFSGRLVSVTAKSVKTTVLCLSAIALGIFPTMRRVQLELSNAFAQVVQKYRLAKGLSRVALAERAGLHQTYIGLLERGKRSPILETAEAIAKALGISLSAMISEAERMQRTMR